MNNFTESYSSFTDSNGTIWDIPTLLASKFPRQYSRSKISHILEPIRNQARWGPDVGTVQEVLETVKLANVDPPSFNTCKEDMLEWHVRKINVIVSSLVVGNSIDPVVIGLDGELWDGLHRLLACHIFNLEYISVVDFSTYTNK